MVYGSSNHREVVLKVARLAEKLQRTREEAEALTRQNSDLKTQLEMLWEANNDLQWWRQRKDLIARMMVELAELRIRETLRLERELEARWREGIVGKIWSELVADWLLRKLGEAVWSREELELRLQEVVLRVVEELELQKVYLGPREESGQWGDSGGKSSEDTASGK